MKMKKITFLLTFVLLSVAVTTLGQETGTFTDSRDKQVYKTVKIGGQYWMAENLAYKPNDSVALSYDLSKTNGANYGVLYTWYSAKKACPAGWHLPTIKEWEVLINYLGGEKEAGKKLKSKSGWYKNGNGTNESGYEGLPGGSFLTHIKMFSGIGKSGNWWSSQDKNDKMGFAINPTDYGVSYGMGWEYDTFSAGFLSEGDCASVRCIKD